MRLQGAFLSTKKRASLELGAAGLPGRVLLSRSCLLSSVGRIPPRREWSFPAPAGALLLAVAMILVLAPMTTRAKGGGKHLPSDPLQGRAVFEGKYCIRCHAIGGAGGDIGPDLAEVTFSGSFLDLASILWNHIPDMAVEYKSLNLTWPGFTSEEISVLISYLYYLRYLGEPGNPYRGRKLLKSKGCLYCHSLGGGEGSGVGPGLDRLKKYASPIYMVQALWNHGPKMQEKMDEMGIERPRFSGQEISDMSAYIRKVSKWSTREEVYLSPGNPNEGEKVFRAKGCDKCHSIKKKRGRVGPALDQIELNKSVTEIAGLMWNHGQVMWNMMKDMKMTWPTFTGKEMADLIAYLYFIKFEDPAGDPQRGKKVFAEKQCLSCHSIRGVGGDLSSDLANVPYLDSDISILRAMINRADKMAETVLKKGQTWAQLTGQDMRDLFAYLKSVRKQGQVPSSK